MRILLLALMIALLPLRGWVGDVMAMEMASMNLHPAQKAINSVASDAVSTGHDDDLQAHHATLQHANCHEGMTTPSMSTMTPSADVADVADCATCSACQICHSVALTPMALDVTSEPLPATLPQAAPSHFASAEKAPGLKPPIFHS